MVVFVELDGDDEEMQDIQHSLTHHALTLQLLQKLRVRDGHPQSLHAGNCKSNDQNEMLPEVAERLNSNINSFSAVLSCYP